MFCSKIVYLKERNNKGKGERQSDGCFNAHCFCDLQSIQKSMSQLQQIQALQKVMENMKVSPQGAPKNMEEAKRKQYQFWDTQPVPKIGMTHSL